MVKWGVGKTRRSGSFDRPVKEASRAEAASLSDFGGCIMATDLLEARAETTGPIGVSTGLLLA